ncbi:hypothetical protein CFP59_00356 [Streptomyces malaysiensis subsp. malaysiensis]|nr:hypothetical protein CFP59_00356 [Streptomyces sp. M56]
MNLSDLHRRLLSDVLAIGSPYPLVITGGGGDLVGPAGDGPANLVAAARAVAVQPVSLRPLRQEVHHIPPAAAGGVRAPRAMFADIDLGIHARPEVGGGVLVGGTESECDPGHTPGFGPPANDVEPGRAARCAGVVVSTRSRIAATPRVMRSSDSLPTETRM